MPAPGTPLRVSVAPWSYLNAQVAPQLIPAGELVTVPVEVPAFSMLRVWVAAWALLGRIRARATSAPASAPLRVWALTAWSLGRAYAVYALFWLCACT